MPVSTFLPQQMLRLQMHATTPGVYVGAWDVNSVLMLAGFKVLSGCYLLSHLSRPTETIVEYKARELKRGGYPMSLGPLLFWNNDCLGLLSQDKFL